MSTRQKHFFVFLLAVSFLFSSYAYASQTKQNGNKFPAGIASIKLGDSERTVYEKILASDDIKTQSNGCKNWLVPGNGELVIYEKDKIDLFRPVSGIVTV